MAPCGSCGGRGGNLVDYEARANDGTVKTLSTSADARLYLATHGGGTVKAVPRKKAG